MRLYRSPGFKKDPPGFTARAVPARNPYSCCRALPQWCRDLRTERSARLGRHGPSQWEFLSQAVQVNLMRPAGPIVPSLRWGAKPETDEGPANAVPASRIRVAEMGEAVPRIVGSGGSGLRAGRPEAGSQGGHPRLPQTPQVPVKSCCYRPVNMVKKISIPCADPAVPPPHRERIPPGARASRPHPYSWRSLQRLAGSHPVGVNLRPNRERLHGEFRVDPRAEMGEAVPRHCRRPRQGGIIHTKNREHGLHLAQAKA